VNTGWMRAQPSSVAFSTMKSVRAFLIGANRSQRSGGLRCGWPGARAMSVPPRRPSGRDLGDPFAVAAVEDRDPVAGA
jgi:hypothetical protein